MRIYKKSGTKERLFEMFENVNKIKLNESRLTESVFFDYILQGSEATEENAIQAAQGLDWQEIERHEGNYPHLRYVDTVNGVGIYYNMGSDNYYFTDETLGESKDTEKKNFEDKIEGGLADNSKPEEFDPIQISKGKKVEKEHTDDDDIALEIASDHLAEIPDYYNRLGKMEDKAKADMKNTSECCCDDETEESLLNPSTHWVDHYTPKNVADESIEYQSSLAEDKAEDYENRNKQLAPNWMKLDNAKIQQLKSSTPKGYKVEIKNISPADQKLWYQSLPSPKEVDNNIEMSSPSDIEDWKNEFISKFGGEGIIIKGLNVDWAFSVKGNNKYDQWKKVQMQSKGEYFKNNPSM